VAFQGPTPLEDFERALIAGGRARKDKRAGQAADQLQRDLLEGHLVAGVSLGTHQEICDRFGIGRWACREAIGILELRGLASARRGRGGGLVAAAPSLEHLANLMLLHLCMKPALTNDIVAARHGVWRAVVRKLVATACFPTDIAEYSANPDAAAPSAASRETSLLSWLASRTGSAGLTFLCRLLTAIYDGCGRFPAAGAGASDDDIVQAQHALWTAICRKSLPEAQAALADYLALTEALPLGARVSLPNLDRDAASVGSAKSARRLATRLLDQLVRLGASESTSLGSESEIAVRYDCNGDIVRQAVRLLEDLGVVAPQRGQAGGLTGREPDLVGIVRLVPHFLYRDMVSPEDARETIFLLKVELGACAARRVIHEGGEGPASQAAKAICSARPDNPFDMIGLERGLSELSGNSILVACELGFVISTPPTIDLGVFGAEALKVAAQTRRIAEAISQGDPSSVEQAMLSKYGGLVGRYN